MTKFKPIYTWFRLKSLAPYPAVAAARASSAVLTARQPRAHSTEARFVT